MAEMKWFHTTLTTANLRIYVEVSGETKAAAQYKLDTIINRIRLDKPVELGEFKPCTKEDEE